MSHVRKMNMEDSVTEYYMTYGMKTIVDRALPDVRDGLKPIHRRILYKMYEIGLHHNKDRAKCHPVVGRVLEIHGHGDSSVYEAMAILTDQNQTLLHPFIDGEGSFGKVYNTNKPSASRYTYARLNKFSNEMFKDLDKNVVDFIGDDYKQPLVLPSTFPNILVKPNKGMSVGFACNFPSFNLAETCDATIAYLRDENADLFPILNIDFSTGASLIYNEKELRNIYETGKGSVKLRSKYRVDGKYIEVYEIPYGTTVNSIIDKVNELLVNGNKLKEIVDIRNESEFNVETDREELKLTIEVKKNTNIELLMSKLFKLTPLESTFSCNMNCLVEYRPKTLGVKEILSEWTKFRKECVVRSLKYDLKKKTSRLHHLRGLEKVLLDIDETIKIIRNTEKDDQVIPNLMSYLNVDDEQAIFISEIKLRNLNKEYILKRTNDISTLEQEIKELNDKINSPEAIKQIIIDQLNYVKKTYGQPRKTEIVYEDELSSINIEELKIEDYNTKVFITKDGYLKKIPLLSMRNSGQQKLKDGDKVIQEFDSTNKSELLFFISGKEGNRVYKRFGHEIDDHKASVLGEYLYSLLELDSDDKILYVCSTEDYKENLLIGWDSGKVSKIALSAYETKQNRGMLKNAFSDKDEPVFFKLISEDIDIVAVSDINKIVVMNSDKINVKSSKTTSGQYVQRQRDNSKTVGYYTVDQVDFEDLGYYKLNNSGVGKFLRRNDKIN